MRRWLVSSILLAGTVRGRRVPVSARCPRTFRTILIPGITDVVLEDTTPGSVRIARDDFRKP